MRLTPRRECWRCKACACRSCEGDAPAECPVWRAEVVAPSGGQPIPCLSQWQLGGRWKAPLTLTRAARPQGGEGDSQEEGEPHRFPLLLCARRAQRHFHPLGKRARPRFIRRFPRPSGIGKGSKLLPPLQRAGERHLVHKFQMPADRDAVRQAGDLDPKRLQQP